MVACPVDFPVALVPSEAAFLVAALSPRLVAPTLRPADSTRSRPVRQKKARFALVFFCFYREVLPRSHRNAPLGAPSWNEPSRAGDSIYLCDGQDFWPRLQALLDFQDPHENVITISDEWLWDRWPGAMIPGGASSLRAA